MESSPLFPERKKINDTVLCFLFVMAIFMPLLDNAFFHLSSKYVSTEKRRMAEKPSLSFSDPEALRRFPEKFDAYFNDHFGFRNLLVRWGSRFRLQCLGISPSPLILAGKQGWLYYHGDHARDGLPIANYRGLLRFSGDELVSVKKNLERHQAWLDKQGIKFLVLIAPDKATIYPEYMPDNIHVVEKYTATDQLYDYLKSSGCRVRVMDLRGELRRAKGRWPLYYKTDHHWNHYGGFLAAQAIVRELSADFPELTPFSVSDYEMRVEKMSVPGDLAEMMGLPDYLEDTEVFLTAKPSLAASAGFKKKSPKVFVFCESFMNQMRPFLSDHFANLRDMRWPPGLLDYAKIIWTRPDVVVLEIEESYQSALT